MAYKKDHDNWNVFHKNLDSNDNIPFFKEREVWWTVLGINVGHEEDGKGEQYSRPFLILRKFGKYTFAGIPLSTTKKISRLHYRFVFIEGVESVALLGHNRSFDSRRLLEKIGTVDEITFQGIRKAAKDIL